MDIAIVMFTSKRGTQLTAVWVTILDTLKKVRKKDHGNLKEEDFLFLAKGIMEKMAFELMR